MIVLLQMLQEEKRRSEGYTYAYDIFFDNTTHISKPGLFLSVLSIYGNQTSINSTGSSYADATASLRMP
jgi:hypothetical protein